MDRYSSEATPDVLLQPSVRLRFNTDPFSASSLESNSNSPIPSSSSSSSSSLVNLQHQPSNELHFSNFTLSNANPYGLMKGERKESPYIIVARNEIFGRFITAKEDIPAGTVIVSEYPTVYGPDGDGCEGYEIPLCLGCCMIMNDDNEDVRCSKCKWPVCSKECELLAAHAENECKFFTERNISFPPENIEIATCYKGIQLLRGLLLESKSQEKWNDIMQLQNWTELSNSRDFDGLDDFRTEVLGLSDDSFASLWNKILGVFNVNSFSFMMKCETEDRSPSFGEFIFLTTSLFSHSCAPNANWAIGCSPDFTMRVRATVDIKKGETISVPYTYDHMNFGTYGRVIRQQSFRCMCQRCLDPTELGTYNSAIKCYKCQVGLVLPLNPTDIKSEWKCPHCLSIFSGDFVILFVEALADEVENCDTVEELERFISVHRDNTLHPNHWVLSLASNSILSQLSQSLQTLSKEQLERFLWHCFYVLQILDVVAPGSSLFRGNVLLLISRALLTKTELCIREGHLNEGDSIIREMKEVYRYQKEALLFWQDDHSYRPQHETYGPEAKDLIAEMSRIKNQYLLEVQDL